MAPNPRDRTYDEEDDPREVSGLLLHKSTTTTTMMQHEPYGTDRMPGFEPLPIRASIYRRKSFIETFVYAKGPPQIIVLIMLFAFGFGSIVGVVPAIMTDRYARINHGYDGDKVCSDYGPRERPEACSNGSADAQNAVAIEQFISNGLTFFTSSLIGSLSDEYGRKGILLLGVFLATLSPIFLLLTQLDPNMSPIWYYTMGAMQGLINWVAVALSALSDVMPSHWRAPSFGLVMAGFAFGFACAPELAIYLGHFYVTILSISVILIGFLVVLFFYPETLPPDAGERAKLSRLAELEDLEGVNKCLWYILRPVRELSILNRSNLFRLLSALAFFSGISASGGNSLFLYYIIEQYGFTDQDIAAFFMTVGILGIFVQGLFMKMINDSLGERRVVIFAFLIGALHDFMYCFAKTKTIIFVSGAMASLVMMAFPTISAIKSNSVNECEQGRVQGALYSVQALASAVGPFLFRAVIHYTSKISILGSGSMFLFSGAMYLVATYFAYLLPPEANSRREGETSGDDSQSEDERALVLSMSEHEGNVSIETSPETFAI